MTEHKVKISEELAKELLTMSYNELSRKGEDIAISEGYHPAGYSFDNPRVEKVDGQWYFFWRCFASCH